MTLVRYHSRPVFSASLAARPGPTRSPWSGLEAEMDRLFEAALGEVTASPAGGFPVDVFADRTHTHVRAHLPGFRREDFRIELADSLLTLAVAPAPASGEKPAAPEAPVFRRTVAVPEETATDQVTATYEHGVLTVTLPQRAGTAPRRISVNTP